MADQPDIDPRQRRLAQQRLTAALRRLHRREPLVPDVRIDALLRAVREQPRGRPGHRGSEPLALGDVELLAVIGDMVGDGRLAARGRRVRLNEHRPELDPQLRERVDRLLAGLREADANPPRLEGVAQRLGIPPPVVAQLRTAGELVPVAPGIDYPRATWESLNERIDRLAQTGPLTVARVRDRLHTGRRQAAAILAYRRAQRQQARQRSRQQPGRRLTPRPPAD